MSFADILISPKVFEAFGIVLAEALLNKTPVVATDIGGVPYVVRHKKDGILIKSYQDIDGFADACIMLLRNKELIRKMGESGKKRVEKDFSWPNTTQETFAIYKQVIKNNKQ